jgi:hypothetical protein
MVINAVHLKVNPFGFYFVAVPAIIQLYMYSVFRLRLPQNDAAPCGFGSGSAKTIRTELTTLYYVAQK